MTKYRNHVQHHSFAGSAIKVPSLLAPPSVIGYHDDPEEQQPVTHHELMRFHHLMGEHHESEALNCDEAADHDTADGHRAAARYHRSRAGMQLSGFDSVHAGMWGNDIMRDHRRHFRAHTFPGTKVQVPSMIVPPLATMDRAQFFKVMAEHHLAQAHYAERAGRFSEAAGHRAAHRWHAEQAGARPAGERLPAHVRAAEVASQAREMSLRPETKAETLRVPVDQRVLSKTEIDAILFSAYGR
jgi:hypothetical protein